MIVLDASVVIALLQEGRPHSQVAAAIMDTEEDLIVHPLTFAEILTGAMNAHQDVWVETALARIGIETWVPEESHPRSLAQLRAQTRLKMPDCCVLAAALSLHADLATFDDRLSQVARSLGVGVFDRHGGGPWAVG